MFLLGSMPAAMPEIGRASVIDMRTAVADHSRLVTHYTFEGETRVQRQEDKKRELDLTARAFGSRGSVDGIQYVPGFDASSTALQPHFVDSWNGAGLIGSPFHFPASGFTVEMLVQPGPTKGLGIAFIGPLYPERGYPLFQLDGHLQLAAGNTAWAVGGARRLVLEDYTPNHWHYVAVTYEQDDGDTLVNSYVADLTAGQTSLVQTLDNERILGTYSTNGTDFGVGRSLYNQEPFYGSMDELAIYTEVLPKSAAQYHLSRLWLIPEPSAAVLACMALGSLAMLRRRRVRNATRQQASGSA